MIDSVVGLYELMQEKPFYPVKTCYLLLSERYINEINMGYYDYINKSLLSSMDF